MIQYLRKKNKKELYLELGFCRVDKVGKRCWNWVCDDEPMLEVDLNASWMRKCWFEIHIFPFIQKKLAITS